MSNKPLLSRSQSGRHHLKPAMRSSDPPLMGYNVPLYSRIRWTFGRGSVIRTIWPSVLFHTLVATVVVALTMLTSFELSIPHVMLTVLGVVLGFVISYRAASGYDRYFMGRTGWSEVMKNARIMSRLIWYHVPPCYTPRTTEERQDGSWKRPHEELMKVMAEKKMALDLIEGYAVSLKHHLRGEPGIYYEDLYDLIRPLHPPSHNTNDPEHPFATIQNTSKHSLTGNDDVTDLLLSLPSLPSSSSNVDVTGKSTVKAQVEVQQAELPSDSDSDSNSDYRFDREGAANQGQWSTMPPKPTLRTSKYRPKVAGEGDNLPLEILRCLSEWCSVLEDRGTVPGSSMGSILGCIASFEDNLSVLEKILTTPLPYAYNVHIRTVWLYLLFLPFQLVGMFGWHSITGVAIASFIYLGFLRAGEEIAQPFGYDENDLDLDLFCKYIIHVNIQQLQNAPSLNAYLPPNQRANIRHRSMTIEETTAVHGLVHESGGESRGKDRSEGVEPSIRISEA